MSLYKHHIFVCTNERQEGHPRGCCKAKNSEELLLALKAEVKSLGLQNDVRVNKSGCLDQCEAGATVVIYPQALWYGGVKPNQARDIVDALVSEKPIESLRFTRSVKPKT